MVLISRRLGAGLRVVRALVMVARGTLRSKHMEMAATKFSRLLVPKR